MRIRNWSAPVGFAGFIAACSPAETGISGSGGTPANTIPTPGYGGNGGTSTTSYGSGGTGGSSASSDPTDSYMAKQIAIAAKKAAVFLWNRDMLPLTKSPFSVSDICLLTGGYSATGTLSNVGSGCSTTASVNIGFAMELCEHQASASDESVVFSGVLSDQWTANYAGNCSSTQSESETLTATGLTVIFKRASTGFQKTFDSCAIELDYTQNVANPPSKLSGRACGISVSVTFSS